jgi:hypothetical protein
LPVVLLGIAILTCFPFVLLAIGEVDGPESDSESDGVWVRREDVIFLVFLLIFYKDYDSLSLDLRLRMVGWSVGRF